LCDTSLNGFGEWLIYGYIRYWKKKELGINHSATKKWNIGEIYTGWWLSHPSEKYESIGVTIPSIWKNKIHVPNHQPVWVLQGFFLLGLLPSGKLT